MDSETRESLLVVACRFVPYDQWLITHLDTSWTIKQVKHWILSKCNILNAPEPPRYRPTSPITFASMIRSGGGFDASNNDEDELDSSSFETEYKTSRRNEKYTKSWHSRPLHLSESFTDDSLTTTPAVDSKLSARYTILTFSNAHILNDDFSLSWYNLRPYEILEVHSADSIVQLPREVMAHYVRPYFEARIRALKVVSRDNGQSPRGAFVPGVRGGKTSKGGKGRLVSSDPFPYGMFREIVKRERAKLEWRERWVVIQEGVLSLCKDSSDRTPSCRIPLTSIIALRGTEHLASASSASLVAGQRIVCIKYLNSPPSSAPHSNQKKNTNTPSSSRMQPMTSSLPISLHSRPTASLQVGDYSQTREREEHAQWIIMDLCDDNAFTSILRILHRHSPRPINSSFLPQSSTVVSSTAPAPSTSSLLSSSSPLPVSFISPFSESIISPYDSSIMPQTPLGVLPYPEWRTELVNQIQKLAEPGGEAQSMSKAAYLRKGKETEAKDRVNGRRRVDTIRTAMSVTSGRSVGAREATALRDTDQESDDIESSDCEWEGWMGDLDRQGRVDDFQKVGEQANRGQQSLASAVAASPASLTRSPAKSLQVQARTFTLSPENASNLVDHSPLADSHYILGPSPLATDDISDEVVSTALSMSAKITPTVTSNANVTASLKVYKNVALLLNSKASMTLGLVNSEIHSLLNDLETQIQRMAQFNVIFSLANSYQFRAQLMAMGLALKCQDDPGFREALETDDKDRTQLLWSALNSDADKKAILQLKGDDAERLLTLTYLVLDKQTSRHEAHRLIVKLSENCGILPASLNITGVTDCGKEAISGGSFADIFQARYQGELVALKRLRDFQGNQQRQKNYRKFCREALLWQDLKHPNILPLYGVDLETFLPRVCMVSPWMPNGTLVKHIEALGGPLNTNVGQHLLEIAEGLKYLHSKNIIHGDLKGDNVFIDKDWHAQLADFGLAGWADVTSTSNHAGSVRWMAPELHTSEIFRRTKLSDVYAFACVFVESYTGKYPFYNIRRDATVICKVIQGKRPERPTADMGRTMSNEQWDLVEVCWKQDPSERPQIVDVVDRMKLMSAAS